MSRRHRRRKRQNPNNGAGCGNRKHTAAAPLHAPLPRRARYALSPLRAMRLRALERRSGRYRDPPALRAAAQEKRQKGEVENESP